MWIRSPHKVEKEEIEMKIDRNIIRGLRWGGVLLIIVGIILPFANLPLQATVIYDPNPPTFISTYPNGDSLNPTPITSASTITLYAVVSDDVDDPTDISVKVEITYGVENEMLTLTPTVDGSGSYLRHEASWTAPSSGTVTFVFEAVDQTGNMASVDAYAEVSVETTPEPEPNPEPQPQPSPSPPEIFNAATVLGAALTAASFILEKKR